MYSAFQNTFKPYVNLVSVLGNKNQEIAGCMVVQWVVLMPHSSRVPGSTLNFVTVCVVFPSGSLITSHLPKLNQSVDCQ